MRESVPNFNFQMLFRFYQCGKLVNYSTVRRPRFAWLTRVLKAYAQRNAKQLFCTSKERPRRGYSSAANSLLSDEYEDEELLLEQAISNRKAETRHKCVHLGRG